MDQQCLATVAWLHPARALISGMKGTQLILVAKTFCIAEKAGDGGFSIYPRHPFLRLGWSSVRTGVKGVIQYYL